MSNGLDDLRHRVAEEHGISDLVHRLRGSTEDELRRDAELLVALMESADRMADTDSRRPAEILADLFRNNTDLTYVEPYTLDQEIEAN